MSRRMWPAAASAIAVAALLGGCGLGFGDEMIGSSTATGVGAGPAVPETATGTGQAAGGTAAQSPAGTGGTTGTAGSGSTGVTSGSQAAGVSEIRDGIWDVGDAGQVNFVVSQGQLMLQSSTPASGWQKPQPPVEQPNQIAVDFSEPLGTTWSFRVQLSGSTMQITKQETIAKAADGSYPVGAAGAVAFISSGSQLKLMNVAPEGGWSVTQQQSSPTSISVSFKQGAGTAQFTAAMSGNDVTVATSQQLSGPVPAK
ncbi:MAG: hypothetical protein ACTHJJ_09475 [Intrasporangium sp.]|uniref:hypothetical protein n=1 Tax=Intrasporangium sp. TaxID=1925024 RepID=UPI003F815B78